MLGTHHILLDGSGVHRLFSRLWNEDETQRRERLCRTNTRGEIPAHRPQVPDNV